MAPGMGSPPGGAPKSGPQADMLPEVDSNIAGDANACFARAEKAFGNKDWLEAIAYYKHVIVKFSFNVPLSAKSELRLGDVAYERERFEEARTYYKSFLRLHPKHDQADYAAFRVGLCAFAEIPGGMFFEPPANERDQTEVRNAAQTMRDFIKTYPSSARVEEAKAYVTKCEDKLASHEMYVARFYERRKKWPGVALRAEGLAKTYPSSELAPEALVLAIKAHKELNQPAEAQHALDQLVALKAPQKFIDQGRSTLGK